MKLTRGFEKAVFVENDESFNNLPFEHDCASDPARNILREHTELAFYGTHIRMTSSGPLF